MEELKVIRNITDTVGDFFLGLGVGITYMLIFLFIWIPVVWVLLKWYNFVL